MNPSRLARLSFAVLAVFQVARVSSAQTCGGELCPGRIWNPAGLQLFQHASYNPVRDEYLMTTSTYTGTTGQALGLILRPDGTIVPNTIVISPDHGATFVETEYNPDRNEFLAVWRTGSPTTIYGRYLAGDGTPISPSFTIGSGDPPHIAYSPASHLYIVTWSRRINNVYFAFYAMIDGNSTNPTPIGTSGTIDANALGDVVEYSSVSNKFLVVYVKDFAPQPRQADIFGRTISATGVLGSVFPIDTAKENQQRPVLASSGNRFFTIYEDWVEVGLRSANATGMLMDANGVVLARVNVARSSAWDVPGAVTYNSATKTFIPVWRSAFSDTNLQHKYREFQTDGTPRGGEVTFTTLDSAILAAASRPKPSDPQVLILWAFQVGGDGVHAGIADLPKVTTTVVSIGTPPDESARLNPFNVSGWAVDPAAPTGTGVSEVHVWDFPAAGGQNFLGAASYGASRPDVGNAFGDPRFNDSGYSLMVNGLANGRHTIRVYAKSTVTGEFDGVSATDITIGPAPVMNVDVPTTTSTLPFTVAGWAIDKAAPSGTGVSEVHIWAFRADNNAGTFLGVATLGISRPDIGALFGAQFANSGFQLQVLTPLPPTTYHIVAYAKSSVTSTFNNQDSTTIMVNPPVSNPAMNVELPAPGASITAGSPINVMGWAADLGSLTGTGVDQVHVYAFPTSGAPVFLGSATYGLSRPDVAAAFGARFANSGFSLSVLTVLPAGNYNLKVYARSTVAGAFNNQKSVPIVIVQPPTNPVTVIDMPTAGATVGVPFTIAGWAADLSAPTGTGVNEIHIWAFPITGGSVPLGVATYGISRPDVGAVYGARFEPSGYSFTVTGGLPAGVYDIAVYARSTVTSTFNQLRVRVTVQ